MQERAKEEQLKLAYFEELVVFAQCYQALAEEAAKAAYEWAKRAAGEPLFPPKKKDAAVERNAVELAKQALLLIEKAMNQILDARSHAEKVLEAFDEIWARQKDTTMTPLPSDMPEKIEIAAKIAEQALKEALSEMENTVDEIIKSLNTGALVEEPQQALVRTFKGFKGKIKALQIGTESRYTSSAVHSTMSHLGSIITQAETVHNRAKQVEVEAQKKGAATQNLARQAQGAQADQSIQIDMAHFVTGRSQDVEKILYAAREKLGIFYTEIEEDKKEAVLQEAATTLSLAKPLVDDAMIVAERFLERVQAVSFHLDQIEEEMHQPMTQAPGQKASSGSNTKQSKTVKPKIEQSKSKQSKSEKLKPEEQPQPKPESPKLEPEQPKQAQPKPKTVLPQPQLKTADPVEEAPSKSLTHLQRHGRKYISILVGILIGALVFVLLFTLSPLSLPAMIGLTVGLGLVTALAVAVGGEPFISSTQKGNTLKGNKKHVDTLSIPNSSAHALNTLKIDLSTVNNMHTLKAEDVTITMENERQQKITNVFESRHFRESEHLENVRPRSMLNSN